MGKKAKTKKATEARKQKNAKPAKKIKVKPRVPAKKKILFVKKIETKINAKPRFEDALQNFQASQHPIASKEEVLKALEDVAVKSYLLEVGGENALKIVEALADPISAEELAKKMELKVSGVRVALNKFHSQGLVEYTKVRNTDSGWYFYVWNFRPNALHGLLEEKKKMVKLLDNLQPEATMHQQDGKEELKNLFACPKCDNKVSFEEAMDLRFKCGDCGKALKSLNGNGAGK